MAGLKNPVVVFQLLLLFFSHFPSILAISYVKNYSSSKLSSSWKNNPSTEMGSWDFEDGSTIRPILILIDDSSSRPPFGFGFFANGTNIEKGFNLVVFLVTQYSVDYNSSRELSFNSYYPPVVLWSANRDKPVKENATLDFTPEGDLKLKDADGSPVWSTNTSGLSVTRLNLTLGGNLMLLDGKSASLWQSFDYPTDTWLPNQNISIGKRLSSRNSLFNLATGLYYLSVTQYGIHAFLSSDPPQKYATLVDRGHKIRVGDDSASIEFEKRSNYARFNLKNITKVGFRYIRLEPTGHLNVYRLDNQYPFGEILSGDLLTRDENHLGDCAYPTVCGKYGVCSDGQCSCPGGNSGYFTQLHDWQPTLGCRQVTPLSCKDKQLHTFLELKNVTSFSFGPSLFSLYIHVQICKKACLDSCTCKAALFRSLRNISYGECYLPSQLYSLMTANKEVADYNYFAFIKVQNSPDKKLYLIPVSVALVLIIIVTGSSYCKKMRINSKYYEEDKDEQVIGALKRFSFLELKSATKEFHTRLGRGGFGSVFEGDLGDGTKVAVKRLDSIGQGRKEFLAEVNTIGSIHHFNLVRLIGHCAEKSNRLLVYEHMCNGSLDKWIFNPKRAQTLSWEIRRKIIIGLAKGLEYLHIYCNPNIIHFDIKPQNILLDGDFNVKISDFGLAKLIDKDQSQVLTVLKGTPGYVAPELFRGTNVSVKADVFSFGIVILEILFGRKNLGSSRSGRMIDIVKEKAEKDQLHDLFDEYLHGMQNHKEEAMKMIKISIWCLQDHYRRPSMTTILKVLEGLMDLESTAEFCILSMPQIETQLQTHSALATNSTPRVASILSGPR